MALKKILGWRCLVKRAPADSDYIFAKLDDETASERGSLIKENNAASLV